MHARVSREQACRELRLVGGDAAVDKAWRASFRFQKP